MFGRNTDDIARTLSLMLEQARSECRYDQGAMTRQVAEWMSQDRRFDSVPDKRKLAADALDAQQHGRQLDLTPRFIIDGTAQRRV